MKKYFDEIIISDSEALESLEKNKSCAGRKARNIYEVILGSKVSFQKSYVKVHYKLTMRDTLIAWFFIVTFKITSSLKTLKLFNRENILQRFHSF